MSKLNLKDPTSSESKAALESTLKENFDKISEFADSVLSRDGAIPNNMEADLDMNSNRVINVADPVYDADLVTKKYFEDYVNNLSIDLRWKGTWDPNSFIYRKNDVVSYNGSMYVSKIDHISEASSPPEGNSNWELCVQKGEKGDPSDTDLVHTVETYTELKALNTTNLPSGTGALLLGRQSIADAAGGVFVWHKDDQSSNVITDPFAGIWVTPNNDASGVSGAWERVVEGPIRLSWFGAPTADTVEAATKVAKITTRHMLFDIPVALDRLGTTLEDGVTYEWADGVEVTIGTAPIANQPYQSYYADPMLMVRQGSIESPTPIQADLFAPRSVDIDTITSANGTAAVVTRGAHGFSVGDYVWILSPSGWYQALEDSGAFYFLSQLPSSHNMLALGEPKLITAVPMPNKFEFACDPNAPASCSIAYALKAQTNSYGIKVADASGFQAGDYVRVESDRLFDSATVGGAQAIRQAEYLMVDRVDVANGWIYVHSGPWLDYATAENAKVAKVNFAKPVRFVNPRIKGRGSTGVTTPSYGADTGYTIDATGDGGLQVWLNEHVEIIGADIRGCERFSIDVQQNYRTLVKDTRLYLESTNDAGRETGNCPLPYGINIGGCSVETIVDGFFAEGDFRHAICEAMDGSFPGFAKDIHIHNAHIRGGLSDHIATHYPNRMIVAENIIGEGAANVNVLETRAGRVYASNIRAHGTNRAVWLFGDVRDVRLENIRGFGLLNEVIYLRPTMATMPGDARSLVIRDVFGDNVKRLLTVYASGGTGKNVEVDVVGARAYDCRQEPLYITSDANVELNVENFFGRRVCTHAGSNVILLSGGGAFSGKTEDLVVKDSPNVERRVTYTHEQYLEKHGRHEGFTRHDVLVQIQNGELVLHRSDDFTINVRGEGYTSDDLDKIVGLKHGQRITLLRYSETITIRDGSNSGAGAAGIQTPGSTDFALSSSNHIAVVHGNSTGGQVYAVVETKRTDT